ncbi:MAG: hypothetical protein OER95_07985 [Acidimicrobiia bacterium]|nr:hypothetical protein [Acidimicrobiia bacterium]
MPIPKPVFTGLLIVATLAAAAGLNMSVLAIGTDGAGSTTVAGAPSEAPDHDGGAATIPTSWAVLDVAAKLEDQLPMATSSDSLSRLPSPSGDTDAEEFSARAALVPTHAADDEWAAPPTSSSGVAPVTRPATDLSTTSIPAAAPPETESSAAEPNRDEQQGSTRYVTYEFEGVASIVVALHGEERIEFWSATPERGWAFEVDEETGSHIKIKFRPSSGGDEAELVLWVDDGEIKVKKEF